MASPFQTLSKTLSAGLNNKFGKGTIYRQDTDSLDDFGDPQISGGATYAFQGIRDNFDAMYAKMAGIPQTDVRILIFNGLTKIPLPIKQTDWVLIGPPDGSAPAQWHKIRQILLVDPAGATTLVQGYVVNEDPTEA